MKDFVIVANFTNSDNGRFTYIANEITQFGDVEIITSNFNHSEKNKKVKLQKDKKYRVTFLNEIGYQKNVCIKRFASHYLWGKEVKKYLKNRKKPDVIYCAVPSLTAAREVAKYCRKNKVKFIIDIQDLWPEAFKMVWNLPIISDVIFAPFSCIANFIYKNADAICAVSNTYLQRAQKVNNKAEISKACYLGTDLKTFDNNAKNNFCLREQDEGFWIGYCGTLGSSYDLTSVIEAVGLIKDKRIKFVVMGDGPRRKEFEEKAREQNINAWFTGLLPYPQMCGLLCACDIVVNPITHMAAQSIINKHSDYAASGLPIINTQECIEYRGLVEKYNMGFNCKNGDANDLAGKIKILMQNKSLCKEMGKNARKCAEECFDRRKTYGAITSIIIDE